MLPRVPLGRPIRLTFMRPSLTSSIPPPSPMVFYSQSSLPLFDPCEMFPILVWETPFRVVICSSFTVHFFPLPPPGLTMVLLESVVFCPQGPPFLPHFPLAPGPLLLASAWACMEGLVFDDMIGLSLLDFSPPKTSVLFFVRRAAASACFGSCPPNSDVCFSILSSSPPGLIHFDVIPLFLRFVIRPRCVFDFSSSFGLVGAEVRFFTAAVFVLWPPLTCCSGIFPVLFHPFRETTP